MTWALPARPRCRGPDSLSFSGIAKSHWQAPPLEGSRRGCEPSCQTLLSWRPLSHSADVSFTHGSPADAALSPGVSGDSQEHRWKLACAGGSCALRAEHVSCSVSPGELPPLSKFAGCTGEGRPVVPSGNQEGLTAGPAGAGGRARAGEGVFPAPAAPCKPSVTSTGTSPPLLASAPRSRAQVTLIFVVFA